MSTKPPHPPAPLDIPLFVAKEALRYPFTVGALVDRLGDLSPQSIEDLRPLVFDVMSLGPGFDAADILKRMLAKRPEWVRSEVVTAHYLFSRAMDLHRVDMVDVLVDAGVDPAYETTSKVSILDLAASLQAARALDPQTQESIGNSLLRKGTCTSAQKDQALKGAARSGNLGMIKSLLAYGAGFGVGRPAGTALAAACETIPGNHQLEIVQVLLQAPGAHQILDYGWGDMVSPPAIHRAARAGNVPVMSMLLEAGACVNPPESLSLQRCQTPLMSAAYSLKPEAADLLIQAGADASAIDSFGRNAFHHLVSHDSRKDPRVETPARIKILNSLIDTGADPTHKDDDGATPMDYAERLGNTDIIEVFKLLDERVSSRHLDRDTPNPVERRPAAARRL